MTVTFLPLTPPGVPRVLELMEQLYATGHDEVRARKALDGLLARPECGGTWLIHTDGNAVGYLILTFGYSLEFHGRYGLLDEFVIAEEWRSRGIGTQALAFAEEWCRLQGLKALRLEVGHQNLRALGLYRRSGFEAPDRHLLTKWL